jgi:hypothetical protein
MAQNGFGARFPISRQSITQYFIETTFPDWFNRPLTITPLVTMSAGALERIRPCNSILSQERLFMLKCGYE